MRVVDGDSYDVLAGGVVYRVRLLGVDAPEPDQPFGYQADDSVTRLLQPERPVLLTRRGLDLYGRTLATVRLPVAGGPALALDSLLVVRGWAWAWDPTPGSRPGRTAGLSCGGPARTLEVRGGGRAHAAPVAAIQLQKQAALWGGLHLVARPQSESSQDQRLLNF